MTGRFDPAQADRRWQARWDEARQLRRRQRQRQAQDLRARDVPLSVGAHPHGPRPQLHDGRRHRPLPPDAGPRSAPPDGLGRVRDAGRECGDGAQGPSGRMDPGQYRGDARPAEAARLRARLEPRARHLRPRLLRPRAGAVPRPVRRRPGLSQGKRGQLGPGRHDRARQRAGDRRQGLALGRAGRAAQARPMVPEDHRLRRGAARRAGDARPVARQGPADAGELDRQEPRPAVPLPARRAGRRDRRGRGLHHPPGHDLRSELRRHRRRVIRSRRRSRQTDPKAAEFIAECQRGGTSRGRDRDRGEEGLSHRGRGRPSARSRAGGCRSTSPTSC